MRVLYLSFISAPNSLITEPALESTGTLLVNWIKRYPKTIAYILIPEDSREKQSDAFKKFKDVEENIRYIEIPMFENQIRELTYIDPKVLSEFNTVNGKYYYDALFCEKPSILSQFFSGTQTWTNARPFKVVIANFHYLMDLRIDSRTLPVVEMNQVMSSLDADIIQFASAHDATDSPNLWRKKLVEYASPSLIREKLKDKQLWVKNCCDIKEVRRVHGEFEGTKRDKFTIHYGFGMNSMFNFSGIYDILKKHSMTDRQFQFMVTTPSMSLGRNEVSHPWVRVVTQCPRSQFFQYALRSHVFIMWVVGAGRGVNHGSVMEMARLGVLPLFYRQSLPYPWEPDYPFQFSSEEELLALVKWIKRNYDLPVVQNEIKKNIELIDHLYDVKDNMENRIDFIEEMHVGKLKQKTFCPYADLLKRLPDTVTLDSVAEKIMTEGKAGIDLRNLRGSDPYYKGTLDDLRTHILSIGYEDVGTPDEVIFRKISDG